MELSDREPFDYGVRIGNPGCVWGWELGGERGGIRAWRLPDKLFRLLRGTMPLPTGVALIPGRTAMERGVKLYHTRDEALADLSDVCLRLARNQPPPNS
jgi:hypothetical protein